MSAWTRHPCSRPTNSPHSIQREPPRVLYHDLLTGITTSKWEEVDYDLEDPLSDFVTSVGGDGDGDPLGLGATVECAKHFIVP